jgi:exodeoxyribonuclease VII large subunit
LFQAELFPEQPKPDPVLSVSELTDRIKVTLEGSFAGVAVAGEICNLSRPQSGHCYLTLKDDRAQLRAVIWRGTAARIRFDLHDGLEVVCRGAIDVYAARGTYQLVITEIQPKGMGALELALRQLQARLAAQGLFDPERKRPLPRFPRQIAVVTSPTGAAIRDFLEVLRRRWRCVNVWLIPVRVQGEGSAAEVVRAIGLVNRLAERIDCLVVARGGGSSEDLWTFNEEAVVRAVAGCKVPVVSAIGHEIDVTLCDLAADVRALTPSEAAELVVPSADEVRLLLLGRQRHLVSALRRRAAEARARLAAIGASRALRRPLDRVHDLQRRLDELAARAARAQGHRLRFAQGHLERLATHLDSLSPVAVLARGYSITERLSDCSLVRAAENLKIGELLLTRFASGQATSRVEQVQAAGGDPTFAQRRQPVRGRRPSQGSGMPGDI